MSRKIIADPPPPAALIVRDASGAIVERSGIGWVLSLGRGVVRTRGLKIGDRVEANGHVIVVATAATVGGRR